MLSLSHFIYSDPTLTLDNLLTVLERVTNWYEVGRWLDVPLSRLYVMTGKESMLREWLDNHPVPSWELLAWALYRSCDGRLTGHCVLKHHLYERYVTGMSMVVYCDNVIVCKVIIRTCLHCKRKRERDNAHMKKGGNGEIKEREG